MCGAIDNTHCNLYRKPTQSLILDHYWCKHNIYNLLPQSICDSEKIFWKYV